MITSRSNTQVKRFRSAARERPEGLCLVEGVRLSEEAVRSRLVVDAYAYSPRLTRSDRGKALLSSLKRSPSALEVSDEVMDYLSETDSTQGILALVRIPPELSSPGWWGGRLPGRSGDLPVWLMADGISDPGNLGTLIRSAEAFGCSALLLAGRSVDPFSPKVVRSSMGSVFRLPVIRLADPAGELSKLKKIGAVVWSTTVQPSLDLPAADLSAPAVILVGGEARGVSSELAALSSAVLRIPTPGLTDSLNAGVAGSIILYEFARQNR